MSWLRVRSARPRILLTGSSGRIGTMFTEFSQGQEYDLVGMDLNPPIVKEGLTDFIQGDIQDKNLLKKAMQGCNTVAHLAAYVPKDDINKGNFMTEILTNNIIGTYRVYETAVELGIPRIVFTSSVQTTDGYEANTSVKLEQASKPTNFYGASKVADEALGAVFMEHEAGFLINLRLGWVETPDQVQDISKDPDSWWIVLSGRDCCEIIKAACLNPIQEKFIVLDALSRNAEKVREIGKLKTMIGYDPQDNAYQMFGVPS